jgi:hypothetical protein
VDNIGRDDLGYSETDMTSEDWAEPLAEQGIPIVEEEGEESSEE